LAFDEFVDMDGFGLDIEFLKSALGFGVAVGSANPHNADFDVAYVR
jgi:hypothetical protein